MTAPTLHYSGHLHFRHRLILSILSGKTIKIDKIRPGDKNPGLRGMLSPDFEIIQILNRHLVGQTMKLAC